MKLNFKKIASVLTGAIMLSSTMGFAAAASFPAPFVSNGASDAAIVVTAGTHTGAMSDMTAAIDLTQNHLNPLVTTGGSGGTTPSGGDSYKFEKTSTKFHLGDSITTVITTSLDDKNLPNLLADGVYIDDDNDGFDFKQTITMATKTLELFDDDSYLRDTPTVGFDYANGDAVLDYTLDFTENPYWDDLTSTDLSIMGKTYYVLSTADNDTLTLLDSATTNVLNQGETETIDGKSVSVDVVTGSGTTAETRLTIDGETTTSLGEGDTYKLNDGSYLGIKDISVQDYAEGIKRVEFSIGNGKLVLENRTEVEMNEEDVDNLDVTITNTDGANKLDTIVLSWDMDGNGFVTVDSSITMPGFETVSLAFGGLNYPAEEEIIVSADGDDNLVLQSFPLDDNTIETINLLYSDGTNFTLIGKDANNKFATAGPGETLTFTDNVDDYFPLSYKSGDDAESYLVRATNWDDSDYPTNTIDFEYKSGTSWVNADTAVEDGDTVSIGNAEFTVGTIGNESEETVTITATGNNNLTMLYSAEGMEVYLPWMNTTAITVANASVNACATAAYLMDTTIATGQLGYNYTVNETDDDVQFTCTSTPATYSLVFSEENEDDAISGGDDITIAVGLDSDSEVYVTSVSTTNNDGTPAEIGESEIYREFTYSALATEILDDQSGDSEKVSIIYHGGEVAADVYITSSDTVITPDTPNTGGQVLVYKDSEVSSFSDKNLVIVGGSCVNEAAAKLLGSDVPVCGADFTAATSVISGGYIIKVFDSPYNADKIAMLVAGYEASDTVNAITNLKENTVSTLVGTEVIYPTTSA